MADNPMDPLASTLRQTHRRRILTNTETRTLVCARRGRAALSFQIDSPIRNIAKLDGKWISRAMPEECHVNAAKILYLVLVRTRSRSQRPRSYLSVIFKFFGNSCACPRTRERGYFRSSVSTLNETRPRFAYDRLRFCSYSREQVIR